MPSHEPRTGHPVGRWMNAMSPGERPQHEQVADQETALSGSTTSFCWTMITTATTT